MKLREGNGIILESHEANREQLAYSVSMKVRVSAGSMVIGMLAPTRGTTGGNGRGGSGSPLTRQRSRSTEPRGTSPAVDISTKLLDPTLALSTFAWMSFEQSAAPNTSQISTVAGLLKIGCSFLL
jgi:hypothetical protein